MRKIEASVQPFDVDRVKSALLAAGVKALTVSDVGHSAPDRGHRQLYRGVEYASVFLPFVKIEVAVVDHDVARIVETIESAVRTHAVVVTPVVDALRIRTGERGEGVL